ncbi:TetR family transcriptional regulator [Cronobacter sakazakii]|uniref:TetR/AcrR family transcriptional regulator n=1 Tax=Cronobacter sakazakii TaxID=28141 RepID=UPI000D7079A4|nr:TetR/AcrR family transcriptional regulator [Cronobacter sakazakii]EKK3979354.1 TetR family transcriptional regulator [Cronobacter sakazakii]EKK5242803.1 TetR family transcriptional regulator [Cronobacter sakazakii]EKM6344517.1 TetR family transcriptional regulator [Cronobacter sakazakii]EKM6352018.1 TetR family transcriptional regulator [Cronobacter sakazakii]EKM6368215.1 TetR family transcriptional regulator [Cronobacter sakazakii]
MKTTAAPLSPRKTPIQRRSVATVEALHTATIQVLVTEGLSRCTTTRVANRAGMSVGSLYQYYPNRDALLSGVLELHLTKIADALEAACISVRGKPVREMADAIVQAYLQLKLANPEESKALYGVAAERDGARLMGVMYERMVNDIAQTLITAPDNTFPDPVFTAHLALGLISGPTKAFLEGFIPHDYTGQFQMHLSRLLGGYLKG